MELFVKIRNDNPNKVKVESLFQKMDNLYYEKKQKECAVNTYYRATFRFAVQDWADKEMTDLMVYFSHQLNKRRLEECYVDLRKK